MQYPVIDVEETGKRIKEICDLRGIQAREIRDYMNFAATQSVYDWFRGKNLPSLDNMYALARLLEVSMDSLIVERGGGADKTADSDGMDMTGQLGYELTGIRRWSTVRILKLCVNQFVPGCKKSDFLLSCY